MKKKTLFILVCLASCIHAISDTITVTTGNGSGVGSLKEAILIANENADADTIIFKDVDIIKLTEELPVITSRVVIDGGTDGVTIDADADVNAGIKRRIFKIEYSPQPEEANDSTCVVALSRLTLINGYEDHGGAVWSRSPLVIDSCTFVNNTSVYGGGAVCQEIADSWINLIVRHSFFTDNTSDVNPPDALFHSGGGAIWCALMADIDGCTFTGNESVHSTGGAVIIDSGIYSGFSKSIRNSVFIRNKALSGGAVYGAGLYGNTISYCRFSENEAKENGGAYSGHLLTVRNSSFLNNKADGNGGAVYGPDLYLENTTFYGNKAAKDGGAVYYSALTHNQTRVHFCTFTANEALGANGAIHTPESNMSIELIYSILTGNKSGHLTQDADIACFLEMRQCIYGDMKYYVQISNIVASVKATVEEVFGTDSPEPNEDGVVQIAYDSPADYKGAMDWINMDQLGNRRYDGYVSIGAWQLFFEDAHLSNRPVQMDNVIVTALVHSLLIQTDKPAEVNVFTLSGQLYLKTNIQPGQTTLSVPAGFYVVRVNDRGWKVVVRN